MTNPEAAIQKNGNQRQLFIAVVGMTPQVVTETLFVLLVQRKIPIDEMFIITTAEGKGALLGTAGNNHTSLRKELMKMCEQYRCSLPTFDEDKSVLVAREETVELHDIRSDRDNQLFPNLIADFIRSLTSDPQLTLHCSVAGGRKTMSIAMAFALSLFGRKKDKLYHVLASGEFEKSKQYFPHTTEEGRDLVLAEVPYIRLRDILPLLRQFPQASFSDYVAMGQGEIDRLMNLTPLTFDRENRTVHIAEHVFRFRPLEFAFYLFVAQHKKPVLGGKRFSELNWNQLHKLYNKLSPATGHKERVNKTISGRRRDELLTKAGSTIRHSLKKVLGEELAKWYAVTSIAKYADVRYTILLGHDKVIVQGRRFREGSN
jgi:CRISPR-associated protein (TIGR02584 family)